MSEQYFSSCSLSKQVSISCPGIELLTDSQNYILHCIVTYFLDSTLPHGSKPEWSEVIGASGHVSVCVRVQRREKELAGVARL